jgi:hypothetical protein
MQAVIAIVMFVAFLVLGVWGVVRANRSLTFAWLGVGWGPRITELSIRVFISCIVLIVATLPIRILWMLLAAALG